MGDFLGIGHAAKHVAHDVSHTGHQIEGGVMQVEHAVQNGVLQIQQETEKGLHRIKGALPDIEDAAFKAVEKVIVPVLSETMKPLERIVFTIGKDVLEEAYGVASRKINPSQEFQDAFNRISFYVANSGTVAIGMYFRNMWERAPLVIAELRKAEKGIPAKRRDILEFVERLGPDAIDVTITAKIPIVNIGGSIGAWGIPAALFDDMLDTILKKAGIPD